MPIIRPYDPERDRDAIIRIWREVHWITSDEQAKWAPQFMEKTRTDVAEVNGEAECQASSADGTFRYQDEDLAMSAIVGVTTQPHRAEAAPGPAGYGAPHRRRRRQRGGDLHADHVRTGLLRPHGVRHGSLRTQDTIRSRRPDDRPALPGAQAPDRRRLGNDPLRHDEPQDDPRRGAG